MTTLEDRYFQVAKLTYQFKQLTASNIHELLFTDKQSEKPCYRVLNRLYNGGYLDYLEYPLTGGDKGGSGPKIWILASKGWGLFSDKPYRKPRAINWHTREIAHTFLELVRLQRAGRFTIEGYATEPDCWMVIDGRDLRPDIYLEIRRLNGSTVKSFLEIDMDSEGEKKVKSKLNDCIYAHAHADPKEFDVWPLTRWIVPDDMRARQLRRWIGHLNEEDQQLFKVYLKADIGGMF
jgi:hypothetical protein